MRVRLTAGARNDLRAAIDYYNEQRPGLGVEFHDAVGDALNRITRLPNAWPRLGPNTRRCKTAHFPYGVIYQLREREILIVAIAHAHRRPGYWEES